LALSLGLVRWTPCQGPTIGHCATLAKRALMKHYRDIGVRGAAFPLCVELAAAISATVTVVSSRITSVHVMNRGSGTVACSVGFGEACFRGFYAVGGVRAAYTRRGRRDRQPQASSDGPAVVKAQDDAGGEGVTCAGRAAYLLA
jgi:hypothetical protein